MQHKVHKWKDMDPKSINQPIGLGLRGFTQSEMIFFGIPQANGSTDGEYDLIANMISLSVIAMHSGAVHLNLHTTVRNLADSGHHCIVPIHSRKVL